MHKKSQPGMKKSIKTYLFTTFGQRCWLCGLRFSREDLTLHHVIPRGYGGEDSIENSAILCKHCHFERVNNVEFGTDEYWKLMGEAFRIAARLKTDKLRRMGKNAKKRTEAQTAKKQMNNTVAKTTKKEG